MTTQTRYRVVTDLTPEEYEEHRRLADADLHRFPPVLEMASEVQGAKFTEEDIPSLLADAVICSSRFTREQKMTAEDSHSDYDASVWPLELKAEVMRAARTGWNPGNDRELSEWQSAQHADRFLDQMPELAEMFDRPNTKTVEAWHLRKHPPADQSSTQAGTLPELAQCEEDLK